MHNNKQIATVATPFHCVAPSQRRAITSPVTKQQQIAAVATSFHCVAPSQRRVLTGMPLKTASLRDRA